MKLSIHATNKRFTYALMVVQRDFTHLFDPSLDEISFIPKRKATLSCMAFHKRLSGRSKIVVYNGHFTISQYINSLVHELTHLQQHVKGIEIYEYDAVKAGNAAEEKYRMTLG